MKKLLLAVYKLPRSIKHLFLFFTFSMLFFLAIVIIKNFEYARSKSRYYITTAQISDPDSITMHADSTVIPVIYTQIPELENLKNIEEKKIRFIHMVLPSILIAEKKLKYHRALSEKINDKIKQGNATSDDSTKWGKLLALYKSKDEAELLEKLHPHPISISLAQAAIESGWGTSRFIKEANNCFGIWSYDSTENRVKAGETRNGKSIFVKKYDDLFQSMDDYYRTMCRSWAFKKFRSVRKESQNPYRLIWFLTNYSEKRVEYVSTLRNVIEYNDLTRYDHFKLAEIHENDSLWQKIVAL